MRRIMVDIDNTICVTVGANYAKAKPIKRRIRRVNKLKEEGNVIIYYTARGSLSGIDYQNLTLKQLEKWGCEYDELIMRKPDYDLFICDRAQNATVLDI